MSQQAALSIEASPETYPEPLALNSPKSCASLHHTAKQSIPLKFPKNFLRKQTETTMLTQSKHEKHRYCMKQFENATQSKIFENVGPGRRIRKEAEFSNLARQTNPEDIQKKSGPGDIVGLPRRKMVQDKHKTTNPIVVQGCDQKLNSSIASGWSDPRRHRDNGTECKNTLKWDGNRQKSYAFASMSRINSQPNLSYLSSSIFFG